MQYQNTSQFIIHEICPVRCHSASVARQPQQQMPAPHASASQTLRRSRNIAQEAPILLRTTRTGHTFRLSVGQPEGDTVLYRSSLPEFVSTTGARCPKRCAVLARVAGTPTLVTVQASKPGYVPKGTTHTLNKAPLASWRDALYGATFSSKIINLIIFKFRVASRAVA
jgi:hypothetical protein